MLRATFKSLLSRKLRLILSGLAVVLGVMFVSGSFVLTDTLSNSFHDLFANAYSHTDLQVSAKQKIDDSQAQNDTATTVPASVINQITAVPGVVSATGLVRADGAHVVGPNGKVLVTAGAPRFGINWTGDERHQLHQDRPCTVRAETRSSSTTVSRKPGRSTSATRSGSPSTPPPRASPSSASSSTAATATPSAASKRSRSPRPSRSNSCCTTPTRSPPSTSGRWPACPTPPCRTGSRKRSARTTWPRPASSSPPTRPRRFPALLGFVNDIFLGFAGVALFVGIFLILNTFSIIVAQRTRELALLRALGGSRNQMIGSVLTEAVVIGVLASTVGLGAGVGVGALLAYVFSHVGGGSLQLAGLSVPASAIIASFAVGITITVVAALLPALRASRIAPIAAMRDAATPDRPLTRVTIIGSLIFAAGAALLGTGLSGAGDNTLALIVSGVGVSFVGIAVLTPAISRPIVSALGSLFSWSVPGRLGKRNSARNPRRTAITAAALMVGIALIVGVNVVLSSAKTSITGIDSSTIKADLVITGGSNAQPVAFDPTVLTKAAAIPGVHEVAGVYQDRAKINGKVIGLTAINEPRSMTDVFSLKPTAGTLSTLDSGQIVVDQPTATKLGLHAGTGVTVQMTNGGPRTFTLSGIYAKNALFNGWAINAVDASNFQVDEPFQAYIQLTAGTAVAPVKAQVDHLLADSPEANVADFSDFVKQQADSLDSVLTFIQILLALAIVIAILGVINTLALSVLERTREIGLLRAIGMSRRQTMGMVTVESVVISVFGAVLGIAVGIGLGTSIVHALHDQGIKDLTLPYQQIIVILILSAIVGVVAAVLPAIRAARTNVLGAISYE